MAVPWMVEQRAEQLVLELRELLVRCDENLKAHTLLEECVPYYLQDGTHPQIALAREHQALMVEHITGGPAAYAAYYEANQHERPFEEQYETEPARAHETLPRVDILRGRLGELEKDRVRGIDGTGIPTLLDCACNDGWLGVNLLGLVDYHGLDLNPDCITRARARHIRRAKFEHGNINQAPELTEAIRPEDGYEYTVAFEVLEHVPDPAETIATLVSVTRPGGRLFLSTPNGAVEHGDLPEWWRVEPKGHVRVFTPTSFHELLEPFGTVQHILLGPDQVLVAELELPPAV